MSHESSVTIERDGRFYNVYGVGPNRGRPLSVKYSFEKPFYLTLAEAVNAAQARSRMHGAPIVRGRPMMMRGR